MFRLWGKIIKNNRFLADHVFELKAPEMPRADKVAQGLEALCYHFDIQKPMWFSDNDKDYGQFGKTRFNQHHFIESIDFDYFEIEIIEDDDKQA